MRWEKLGHLYVPPGDSSWAKKYAFPPTPAFVRRSELRLYLCFCDDSTVGRVGYVDVALDNPSRILRVSPDPVLDIGTPGAFDENGVLPTCVVPVGQELFLYYVGYQLGMKVRYFQFQGLAISRDGGESFQRYQQVPIRDRSDAEHLNPTTAIVRRASGVFSMWYVGGSQWERVGAKSLPVYDLRYAESEDGKRWPGRGSVCLQLNRPDEHAFGRPWVRETPEGFEMFFSVRTHSKGYRLGYARSEDGKTWERLDAEVGIDVSSTGWDSEMIAYSAVVDLPAGTTMFYNGNNCGETGFGVALLR